MVEVIPALIAMIANGYDRGFEGWQVAAAIDVQFSGAMAELKPMLGDPVALTQFVAGVPPLAERSSKPERPEFQTDFMDYVQDNYGEQPETATAEVPKVVTAAGAA